MNNGIFQMNKSLKKVIHIIKGSFENCQLKYFLRNQNWLFYGITVNTPLGSFIFLRIDVCMKPGSNYTQLFI